MRLHIEPFDKQPPEGWVLDEIKSHTVRFISPGKPHFGWNTALPHRPGDPLHGGVVERVEARQARDITQEEWALAGFPMVAASLEKSHKEHDPTRYYWLRED